MALLPTDKDKRKVGAEDISIKNDIAVDLGKNKFSAKDRKPVQVDPPVLKDIRDLSYAKDIPMYEIVELAMEALKEQLDEDERAIYNKRN